MERIGPSKPIDFWINRSTQQSINPSIHNISIHRSIRSTDEWIDLSIDPSIHSSIHPSIHRDRSPFTIDEDRLINPCINQWRLINHSLGQYRSIHLLINLSIHPIHPSIHQSIDWISSSSWSINTSVHPSIYTLMDRSINPSIDRSIGWWINPLIDRSINQLINQSMI